MFLVDSHCHLDMLDHPALAIQRAQENGVQYFLNVCVSLTDFPKVLNFANDFPNVGASVGLHPNEQGEEIELDRLVELAKHSKVIAIGETGLDYFRSTGDLTWQRDRFRRHIAAAKITKKPLIVHMRQAKEDVIKILKDESADQVGGVMHCFSEDLDIAELAMEMNFYISFSGTVTFKNATPIQEVAKVIPLDKILIETDSPYLAPMPMRGKPNEPGYVLYTAEFIAKLRGMTLQEFAEQTTKNFFNLFKEATIPHV